MIDLRLLRENPELFRQASRNKRLPAEIDAVLSADARVRELLAEVEQLRAERNTYSRAIGKASGPEREAAIQEARRVRERLEACEPELRAAEQHLSALLLTVPNVPAPEVPVGAGEEDNLELRRWGTPREFDFEPRDHVELATALDIADFGRAGKVSGSRFYYLKGEGTLLQLALIRFALDLLYRRGFTPMVVPELVREEAMTGTGFFPVGRDDAYALEKDGLFLVGTSEVSLVAYHAEEVLPLESLPRRYAGVSSCFRREAGAAGKDTRGFYRVHQFQKVEQVVICASEPEAVAAEHQALLANAEALLQALGLPHRVCLACTAELGMGQVLKHEVETWMPSRAAYSETHSCSTLGEYQSRRLNIRYRDAEGRMRFCATLNNTAIAAPRILIPLLETYQQADGSVVIPEVLHPYLPGITVLRPRGEAGGVSAA
jgi:seryl-tRNA synthetase